MAVVYRRHPLDAASSDDGIVGIVENAEASLVEQPGERRDAGQDRHQPGRQRLHGRDAEPLVGRRADEVGRLPDEAAKLRVARTDADGDGRPHAGVLRLCLKEVGADIGFRPGDDELPGRVDPTQLAQQRKQGFEALVAGEPAEADQDALNLSMSAPFSMVTKLPRLILRNNRASASLHATTQS